MGAPENPITREEQYLAKIAGDDVQTPSPVTRVEKYLQKIIDNGGGGGGGGTSNYNELQNLPQINSHTLTGNQSGANLGLIDATGGTMSGNIAMGGNKVTGLASGTDDADAVTLAQMNEAISSSTAFFRGSFATKAALLSVAWQTADPTAANFVSNNDYAYVGNDESKEHEAWRYIYVLEDGGQNNGWRAQFRVNEAPFTVAQLAAINSGATTEKIDAIATKAPLTSPSLTGTPTAPTAASGTNTTQIATTAFVQTEAAAKVDLAQGVGNAGKYLVVGSDGNVTTQSIAAIPVTLAATNWSNNQQTVTVQGVLADETKQLIQPVPAYESRAAYDAAAIRATAQAANSITFDCQSPAPSVDLAVFVVVTPLSGGAL